MRHTPHVRYVGQVILSLALLLAASSGCSVRFELLNAPTDLGGDPPASVIVVASVPALIVGQSTKLAATVKDATGNLIANAAVIWSASDAAIASVTNDGTVSALSSGNVIIFAASGTAKGEWAITVQSATGPTPPVVTPPPSQAPSPATLPHLFDVPMPAAPAAGGSVIAVGAADNLQAAIDRANPGDVIELAAGATYTGNYVLRAKPGNSTSWIVIRPVAASVLPVEGRRMTPALAAAANLPHILTPNSGPAFQTEQGAHHYRLIGLDVSLAPSLAMSYSLIGLGTDGPTGQTTLAVVPHHIVLDRMYIHGNSTATLRRGVALNSAFSAVIDSYISEVHEKGADSQAIMGWNGPGPYKIVNNYLEAAGEVIMFGGGSPGIPNLVPSDIEVRRNHLTRPLSWKGVWQIKNLFELKNARRVLVEGNVMENNWAAAQDGTAIVLKSTDQDGVAPWSGTTHVTFRLNIVRNTGAGFLVAAHPEVHPVEPLHSVAITNNILSNFNTGEFLGSGRGILTQGDIIDVSISHNTIYNETQPYGVLIFGPVGAKTVRFSFTDNLSAGATNWGVFGDNVAPGTAAMTMYAPDGTLTGNVFAGAGTNSGNYPAGNFFTARISDVGFSNPAGADFSLLITSPFKGKATDGKDPGADVSAVLAATNGVVIP